MANIKTDQTADETHHWCSKFQDLWKRSDFLFGLLRSPDDFYRQPIKLRLPLLFYLGHLPCFAWLQFNYLENVHKIIDVLFDQLFQRGVDPNIETGFVEHEHSSPWSMNDEIERTYWRSFNVDSVIQYKNNVQLEIIEVLKNGKLNFNDHQVLNILHIAIEHEMMHQETLMYLFAQLPIEAFRPDIFDKETDIFSHQININLNDNKWIKVPTGYVSLGKAYNGEDNEFSFGWDNEFPSEPTYVSAFEMQSHPVRIGDYLEFVLEDGYKTKEWWNENTYEWLVQSNIHHPISWTYDKSYYVDFILKRHVPIEYVLDHPVLVSQVEAQGYCRWLSKKLGYSIDLPTESEWVYAMWDYSKCLPKSLNKSDSNVNFRSLHTIPVEYCNEENLQWNGSAFEWTLSLFRPFKNYCGSLPTYAGYSSDFFDDHHFVLLGGSFATDLKLIRRTFRNWYQNKYRHVFSTFRCVKRNENTDNSLTSSDRNVIIQTLSNQDYRSIPSEYFYDAYGSAIYEQITQLKEYYLYGQEFKLLKQRAHDIRNVILQYSNLEARCSSSIIRMIEFGCGDGSKIETWLTPWIEANDGISFVYQPIDISQHAVNALMGRLKRSIGESTVEKCVKPVCSTFGQMFAQLKYDSLTDVRVFMLMGSTIGNFSSFNDRNIRFADDSAVMKFFHSIRSNLKVGDWFICAFDLCKDTKTMLNAYADSKGVTEAFNYNLLLRLNRELNFNFQIHNFQHCATFNPIRRQMESWLISLKHQIIQDQHGFTLELQPYEPIHTEISTKYTREDIDILMKKNSFEIIEYYQSDDSHLPYVLCLSKAI